MLLASFVQAGERALDAVSSSFSPRPNATSKQIRKNGALCLGVGLLCFGVGGAAMALAPKTPVLAMLPIFLGYALTTIGAYRALLGKSPKPNHPGEVSAGRVIFAVGSIVVVFGALIGLALLLDYLSGGQV